jgi:hypothetical protein
VTNVSQWEPPHAAQPSPARGEARERPHSFPAFYHSPMAAEEEEEEGEGYRLPALGKGRKLCRECNAVVGLYKLNPVYP